MPSILQHSSISHMRCGCGSYSRSTYLRISVAGDTYMVVRFVYRLLFIDMQGLDSVVTVRQMSIESFRDVISLRDDDGDSILSLLELGLRENSAVCV